VQDVDLQSASAARTEYVIREAFGVGVVRVDEHGNNRGVRDNFVQQFHPLQPRAAVAWSSRADLNAKWPAPGLDDTRLSWPDADRGAANRSRETLVVTHRKIPHYAPGRYGGWQAGDLEPKAGPARSHVVFRGNEWADHDQS
jgi:hypothetical protein